MYLFLFNFLSVSTASSTSSGVDSDVSRGEEQRLRETIGKMREERSQVAASILPLESIHVDPLTRHYPLSLHDAHKLDLENAVLMQELTAMREDRAELRAQVREVDVERFPFSLFMEKSGKMLYDLTVFANSSVLQEEKSLLN